MFEKKIQIVGVIDRKGRIESEICTFSEPVFHKNKWPDIKKNGVGTFTKMFLILIIQI